MNFLFRRVTPLASSMRPNARPLVAGSVRASASGPVQQQRPLHRLWKRVTDDDTGEGRRLLVLGFITGGVATALLFEILGRFSSLPLPDEPAPPMPPATRDTALIPSSSLAAPSSTPQTHMQHAPASSLISVHNSHSATSATDPLPAAPLSPVSAVAALPFVAAAAGTPPAVDMGPNTPPAAAPPTSSNDNSGSWPPVRVVPLHETEHSLVVRPKAHSQQLHPPSAQQHFVQEQQRQQDMQHTQQEDDDNDEEDEGK